MKSEHEAVFRICQSSPLFAVGTASVAILMLFLTIPEQQRISWGFTFKQEPLKVDEDLPNFFEAIRLIEADRLIEENRMMQRRYGFEIHDCDFIYKLENIKWPDKPI